MKTPMKQKDRPPIDYRHEVETLLGLCEHHIARARAINGDDTSDAIAALMGCAREALSLHFKMTSGDKKILSDGSDRA
jgi:hypothetical protein